MALARFVGKFSSQTSQLLRCPGFHAHKAASLLTSRNLASQTLETDIADHAAKANYEARCDLAACYRILYNLGFDEGVCNHLSLSCPAKDGSRKVMLMIPHGLLWPEVTASSLVGISLKDPGSPEIYEEGYGQPDISSVSIHTGIHHAKGKDGFSCILHSHVPYATSLTCIEGQKLEMVHQNSARFLGEVCYDNDYDGVATSLEEGERLGKALEGKTVMMMGHHGVLVIGRTPSEAFDQLYYLERAAKVQVLAMSTGRKLAIIPDNILEVNKKFHRETFRHYADAHFVAMKRSIEAEKPHYRS